MGYDYPPGLDHVEDEVLPQCGLPGMAYGRRRISRGALRMMDLWRAIGLLSWNAVLFLLIGRWSVIRGPRYRMGDKIVDDITEVLDRRQFIGDNAEGGMTIVSTSRWYAYGYNWEISVVQQRPSNGDRYDSRTKGSTLPQG
jgi:hypothetical protein